jgi:hypothetical protein
MRNKNFVVIFMFVLGMSICIIGVSIVSADGLTCEKPKEHSKKACLDPLPNDAVSSCGSAQTADYCNGNIGGNLLVYEVNQFPTGTEEAEAGGTHTPQRDCWRSYGCTWNQQTQQCVDISTWSPWHPQNRIESDPNAVCPSEQ